MIFVENKKKSINTLLKLYPNAEIIDITSKGKEPYVRLSPFYPHKNIPVPFSEKIFSNSVEGIWQGLKVFEFEDIDTSKFEITNMKGIKRTVRKLGKPLGHRNGVSGLKLLDYVTARKQIFLPSFEWVLLNRAKNVVESLVKLALKGDLVLLDYETNCDIENTVKPLSHAALVKIFIEKNFPEIGLTSFNKQDLKNTKPLTELQSLKGVSVNTVKKTRLKKNSKSANNSQLTMDF